MPWSQLPCYHAGPAGEDRLRPCFHPQLVGLKIVGPEQCGGCSYRQRWPSPDAPVAAEHRSWDCAWLAADDGQTADLDAVHACRHLEHQQTTRRGCGSCRDYLFPVLSPRMPVEMAADVLRAGARQQPDRWWTWPNVQAAFRLLMEQAIDGLGSPPRELAGRGIVIVGGGKYLASAYVTLRVLRHVGCTLPVQLWHLSGEVDDHDRALLAALDCECIDGEEHSRHSRLSLRERTSVRGANGDYAFPWHPTWWRGWQLKSYALAHCPFREVLYLDADCYPTRDPAFLFEERGYRERGAIFWPDLVNSSCLLPHDAPAVFGAPALSDLPSESGQLLINKEQCWRELQLALFLNAHAEYTYRVIWGDKDTFPIAWRRLGREYYRLWPVAGTTPQALLQYDGRGEVLFQHRASDKFRLPGTQFDSNHQQFSVNQRNPNLAHEDFCHRALEELRQSILARETPGAAEAAPTIEQPTTIEPPMIEQPTTMEEMYPPVRPAELVSPLWQERFREYFLDSGELPADPFQIAERTERPQRKCISVCLFKKNVNSRHLDEFGVDEVMWRNKYWSSMLSLVRDMGILPDWKLRIYVEGPLWAEMVREVGGHPQVELYRMQVDSVGQGPGALWRFLALDDRSLDLAVVADIDDPLHTKLDTIRSFELDDRASLGRLGGFTSHLNYFVSEHESRSKNYATIIACCVISRPARFDFDVAAALRGFMAHRRYWANSDRPWAYAPGEPLSDYNVPIGTHLHGWGSHWYIYCFDERFLKHVVYYHFAEKGELLTWAPILPPERLNPEGLRDLDYVRSRGNTTVNAQTILRVAPLNLSPDAFRAACVLDEYRWIFDSLLEIMRAHPQAGWCGNVRFHEMADTECLSLVPKQINLFRAAQDATQAIEIGFNAGHSAAIMLLANPYLTIRAFDFGAYAYTNPCLDFLNSIFRNRITLVRGPSQSTVPADVVSGYDLAHIDGDHTYAAVASDLASSLPKCRPGATIIMDDFEATSDVERATLERTDLVRRPAPLHAPPPGSSHAIFTYTP